MREVFQQELTEVQDRLVRISNLVAESIEKATTAFNSSDVTLAESVIADDHLIDELASSLDELAIDILARQQPVARDLRIVVSALRISASLERMGDISEHIAQLARYRFPDKVVRMAKRKADELEDFAGKHEEGFVQASKEDVEEGSKLLKEMLAKWKGEVESQGLTKKQQVERMRELVKENQALQANGFFKSIQAL